MEIKNAISDSKPIALPFLVGLSIYSLVGMGLFFTLGNEETHTFLNSNHTPLLNQFFRYLTHFGHGFIPIITFLFLLFVRYSWAVGLGLSSLVMGVVVQSLKRNVFAEYHRPAKIFQEGVLPHIEGVELMIHHSFPSGHSATGLCLVFMLAVFMKKRWFTYLMVVLGLLTAFSRVYISQHFIQDTVVGGWIGFIMAFLGYIFIIHYAEMNPNSKLNGRFWSTT
jgi:membrane-associated phospholipid phosphatase